MSDTYTYPAFFTYEDGGISVEFPDLPGCLTCGADDADAMRMATEVLGLCLCGMERDREAIPAPTPVEDIPCGEGMRVVLVHADMVRARAETIEMEHEDRHR